MAADTGVADTVLS